MPLLKVKRSAQITIPLELRKRFRIDEGDYIEASALPEGILLKPITLVEPMPENLLNQSLSIADWESEFQSWADSHSDLKAVVLDDSRAAIYGDDER